MTGREIVRFLRKETECEVLRQKGSHVRVRCCNDCFTTIPVHKGEDLGRGILRSIERDLEPCLGKGWTKRA